ncbi:gamma-glutamylcyclotransferase [Ectobacillus panaciterrae]|uniref:gamma-glutamylcyclotransferase n=1 Tax=Ectobacillus panaciterrae TaxID=363872 RepID=UPI000428D5DA|nr:gamma-glutamylcyclotransferase [Ectobacillus panaciterrae]
MRQNDVYVLNVIKRFFPPRAELMQLTKPNKPPAVLLADLDGDKDKELTVVYRYQGKNYVMVLKRHYNTWYQIANMKGKGYNITDIMAAPITSNKINNLIIGWQIATIWSELDLLQWIPNGFQHLLPKEMNFSKIEVEDMPGEQGRDGRYEIALWKHETAKAHKVEVYRWNHNELVPAKDVYPYYFKKVITYYETLIQETPDSSTYWYYLADAQSKAGLPDKALQSVDKALYFPYPYPSKEALLEFKGTLQTGYVRQMMYYNGFSGYIVDFQQGDVNGDGIIDQVFLVGDRAFGTASSFADKVVLVVLNGKTKEYKRIPLKEAAGFNPTIFLGDFTGDKVNDILIIINSGGSGGSVYGYLYSFLNGDFQQIFDFELFNRNYRYDVVFKDDYKLDVISSQLNKKYTLDIADKGSEYLSTIYDKDHKLKGLIKGDVADLSGLYPIDFERDGTYELYVSQSIIGQSHADKFGFVDTVLHWNGVKLAPSRQTVSIYGEELNAEGSAHNRNDRDFANAQYITSETAKRKSEGEKMQYVFVYGTLRKHEKYHHILHGATCISQQAWTYGQLFDSGFGYPAMTLSQTDKTYGEMYAVNDEQLRSLDVLEGYTDLEENSLYTRITKIIYTDKGEVPSYVYVSQDKKLLHKPIEHGDWKLYKFLQQKPSSFLYFAYGSCMDHERFKKHGVEHYFQDVKGAGVLNSYVLQYTKKSQDGGRADIVECSNEWVEGVIYETPQQALDYLFKREGVSVKSYRPTFVDVQINGHTLKDVLTFVVVHKERETAPPEHYAREILRGAKNLVSETYYKKLREDLYKKFQMKVFL